MSGIVGLYWLDGRPVEQALLVQMTDSLAHRGPDGAGLYRNGAVGLGHRLLWNTPESLQEQQPLVDASGDLVITADARLDNREALLDTLRLPYQPPGEITDSQLILAAYARWGKRCVEQLLGDFAFAIWDSRRQLFFCARDHFGLKPFCYHYAPNLFTFASEIKAILCVPGVPRRLNEVRVGDFLAKNFEDKTITFYQEIVRLPAASCMTVTRSGRHIRRYWTPDLARELRLRTNHEYSEAFREVFTTAVRCRLRTAFGAGSTLSGGLDSSAVACTAAKVLAEEGRQRRLHTFSAVFPNLAKIDPRIDERRYIEAVLHCWDFEAHQIRADWLTPLLPSLWQEDEVLPGINLYMDHAFFTVANAQGVRVLLSGHDGDTVISHGYERLMALACTLRWPTLLRESATLAERHQVRLRSILWRQVIKPLVMEPAIQAGKRWRTQDPFGMSAGSFIQPAFARRIRLADRLKTVAQTGSSANRQAREQHWQAINSGLFSYIHETLDKMAARFAVEPRHPFFDKRLVEFSLALPLDQKLQQGWSRAILRHAMEHVLPAEVQWRPSKSQIGANFKLGLLKKERKTLTAVLNQQTALLEEYINIPALQVMYQRYQTQPLHHEEEALAINVAVLLALWLEHTKLQP